MKLSKQTYYILMFLLALGGLIFSSWAFLFSPNLSFYEFALILAFCVFIYHSIKKLKALKAAKPSSQKGMGEHNTFAIVALLFLILLVADKEFYLFRPTYIDSPSCFFSTGISCEDWAVEKDRIRLIITNGKGDDIIIKKVIVSEASSPSHHVCEMTSDEIKIQNGESGSVVADDCTIRDVKGGHKYKYEVNLTYSYAGSDEGHIMQGVLFDRVGQ